MDKSLIFDIDSIIEDRVVEVQQMYANRSYLRVSEVAEHLGFSRRKIYDLINDGSIVAVRMMGSIRVPVSELIRVMRSVDEP